MLFNSYSFIFLFLPITLFLYFQLNRITSFKVAQCWLVVASLFFYGWWNPIYLILILSSMIFNYIIGMKITKQIVTRKKYYLLFFGVTANLLLLGYFKYADFFLLNINIIFTTEIPLLNLALPLAISFFTFQQIAYLVDSYKEKTKEYDFLTYALFVTFFPQLIAGPIVHHKQMLPQFNEKNRFFNSNNFSLGLFVFSLGLFKKVVIADKLAVPATYGFDIADSLDLVNAWFTSLSYTFQLYFDFSGYTDMAIGLALLFNIKLPVNFNSPYKSLNIQDFWRRWHITLSTFLRDYIYIPLGGSRKNNSNTYRNLLITFILGGLWHGAGWNFILWGGLHGLALVIHRAWQLHINIKLNKWLSWFITFNFINITWVFFRAKDWNSALKVLQGMFDFTNFSVTEKYQWLVDFFSSYNITINRVNEYILFEVESNIAVYILLSFILVLFFRNTSERIENFSFSWRTSVYSALCFSVALLFINKNSEFLYFNF